MLLDSPQILSGVSFCSGQTWLIILSSGVGFLPGQSIDNFNPRFAPDIFKLIFGENALQNSTQLTINKSDLVGLTPQANNTAESLLVAIIARNINSAQLQILSPKLDIEYWGHGVSGNSKVDTLLIKIHNLISSNDNEIEDYTNIVNPNDY
jgi:hypothetical protein